MGAGMILAALSCFMALSWAANITCPATPSPWPKALTYPVVATMPDPFIYLDGKTRVQSQEEWFACRQPEILQMLQQYQYGFYPDHSKENVTTVRTKNNLAITVTVGSKKANFAAQLNLPSGATASKPVPVVIAIGGIDNSAYLTKGIAVATFDYSSVAADSNTKSGAFWSLYNGQDIGTLVAWAWGFHRVLDAITLAAPEINPQKVGVTGCSRLGKAALAAGLFDTRITVTMPMSSGVQGLGPYRYHALSGQDETLENSKSGAPWWSNSVLGTFVDHSTQLPFDAHTVASAIAPRALIIDQGRSDPYTNSKGTAIIVYPAAKLVYDWIAAKPVSKTSRGVEESEAATPPSLIGMALRDGGHCDNSGYANVEPFVAEILLGTPTTRDYTDLSPWTAMTTAYPWSTSIPT